jgi:hypothetical protein
MEQLVTKAQSSFFSDADIRKWLGADTRVIRMCELQNYRSLEQAAPNGVCVVLFETERPNANGHTGHWCCFFQVDAETWEWFDPYGVRPGSERDFLPEHVQQELKEDQPLIETLIANSAPNTKMIYNQARLQQLKKGIDTCGRWVCVRVLKRHVPLAKFQESFMKGKLSGDWIVTCMTML